MKHIFLLFLLITTFLISKAQLVPVTNSPEELLSKNVKSVSVYYSREGEEYELYKLEYNQQGQLLSKYQLYLWDVVTYSYSHFYVYNSQDDLVQETRLQEILELDSKDSEYIETFGNSSVNQTIILSYDDEGRLVEKRVFKHSDNTKTDDAEPDQTITYEYDEQNLVKEISLSKESRVFNNNYSIEYIYGKEGRLISSVKVLNGEKEHVQNTELRYNEHGLVSEKKVTDRAFPHNGFHEKYEYDSMGQLWKKYEFSEELEDFELEIEYAYDSKRRAVSGEREVKYEYDSKGLIISESWIDDKTGVNIIFKSSYGFYNPAYAE